MSDIIIEAIRAKKRIRKYSADNRLEIAKRKFEESEPSSFARRFWAEQVKDLERKKIK